MKDVWIAVRASLRSVLEQITLADVVAGELPEHVRDDARRRGRLGLALAPLSNRLHAILIRDRDICMGA